jgi:hypothetical protein
MVTNTAKQSCACSHQKQSMDQEEKAGRNCAVCAVLVAIHNEKSRKQQFELTGKWVGVSSAPIYLPFPLFLREQQLS